MKNKKIILNLLLSFVMAFVIGFGFSVKANVNKAHAITEFNVNFNSISNQYSNYQATITEQTTFANIVNGIKNANSNITSQNTITFYFYYMGFDGVLGTSDDQALEVTIDEAHYNYDKEKVLTAFAGCVDVNDNYYFTYEVVTATSSNDPDPTPVSDTQEEEKSVRVFVASNNTDTGKVFEGEFTTISALTSKLNEYSFDYLSINGTVYSSSSSDALVLPAGETAVYLYQSNSTYSIKFKDQNGTIVTDFDSLDIYPLTTISQLRTELKNFNQNKVYQADWKLNNVLLDDESRTFASYGLKYGDTITVSQKTITIRPVVEDTREYVTTKRVYVNQTPDEVVVKYYVTQNDGVNSFVLVPSYDKDVFTLLDNQNNPRVQVSGIASTAVTVTGNVKGENDPEFVKIAFDSSTLYDAAHEYSAESNENVLVLTLTFTVHTAPANYGHYRGFFGLVLDDNGKTNNTSSVAYQDLSGEKLGNQEEVLINLDVDDPNEVAVPENVVDIYRRHTATITTDAASFTYTYRKQAMPVTKVTEYTSNLTYGVEYKYNGNGDPVVTWKDSNNNVLESAPQNAGTYTVTISVPATDTYTAVEPVTIPVTINKALVTVTIKNQTKVYGETPVSFAGNFGVNVPSGLYTVSGSVYGTDTITFNLTSAVTASSNAGSYPISKTNVSISDGNNGNNYGVDIFDGTYTVTKYTIKIYYGFEQTTFNGGTKTAYSLTGTPNITNNNYEALEEDISGLLGTVNVTYSIALPEGVVPANDPKNEEACYTVTPLYAFVKEGSANNFEVIAIQSGYRINQAQVRLVAGNASAEFNGGTKANYAAPTEYYVYAGSTTTPVSEALRTALGTVTLTVNFPETGVVNAGNYTITPHYTANNNLIVTTSNGTYTINAKDLTDEEKALIYAAFGIVEVTYDGQGHQMYTFDASGLPLGLATNSSGYSVSATINGVEAEKKTDAGTYLVSITFTITDETINQNRNSTYGTNNYEPLSYTFEVKEGVDEFAKYSKISQKAITITADNKGHTYGSNPATLTPATAGINGEVAVTFTVKNNNNEAVTLSQTTPAGTYTIVPSATNANYAFTFVNGTYTVSKGQASITSVTANDVFYNRALSYTVTGVSIPGKSNPVEGTDYTVTVTLDQNSEHGSDVLNGVRPYGTYTVTATVAGTDNYDGATKSATFHINQIALATPTVTYSAYNTAKWAPITKDCEGVDLVEGTEVINNPFTSFDGNYYYFTPTDVLSEDTLYTLHHGTILTNDNYLSSSVELMAVVKIEYVDNRNDHSRDNIDPENMPDPIIAFTGENVPSAPMPQTNPTLPGYTFNGWVLDGEGPNYKTTWTINKYTVTFKFTENSATANTDLFTSEVEYKGTIEFAVPTMPTKESGNAGFVYSYNKKAMYNNATYDAVYANEKVTISGYEVTGNGVVFVAQYDTQYNKFNITYKVKDLEGENTYALFGEQQEVVYGATIEYRAFTTNVQWFTAKAWFANEAATEAAPATMPAQDITVYGVVVFDIGTGDVNGNKAVTADDITLYRQWIVGGYEMTVVEAGTEWETATNNFDPNKNYYLARVADNNNDNSKDIRDVSVTRMAIVGGYTWGIRTGLNVTGQEIKRDGRANSLSSLSESLQAGERVTLIDNITDTNVLNLNLNKNVYINLNGKTLTVSQLTLNVKGDNTITIENGTIVTTYGVTLTAPNGSVVLTSVTAYDKDGLIQLQAANHSLHFNGVVNFYQGVDTTVENPTPAAVKVEKGTHIVVEKEASVVVKKLVVTEQFVATVAADAEISIENNSLVYTPVTVEGNVVVDNDVEIDTFEELVVAATKDGSYILNADIDLTSQVNVTKNVTLNLNGHKLYNTVDIWNDSENVKTWSLISVKAGKLTINGEGSLLAKANDCYAVDVRNGAELVINGGNYAGNISAVYVHDGALTVNGGYFYVQQSQFNSTVGQERHVLNCLDANYKNGTATIVVNGGSFKLFNPGDCVAEGNHTNFIGEDVFVVQDGDVYTVLPVTHVSTLAELKAAFKVGGSIKLDADILVTGTEIADRLAITVDTDLDLNGYTLKSADGLEPGSNWATLWVNNGAVANISNGTIGACYDSDGKTVAPYGINVGLKDLTSGTVNLRNVNVYGGSTAVQVILGEANIYSGSFKVSPTTNTHDCRYELNCIDGNYSNGTAHINVYGGTFENYDPSNNLAEGPNTNFLVEGHTVTSQVVEENTVYTVA